MSSDDQSGGYDVINYPATVFASSFLYRYPVSPISSLRWSAWISCEYSQLSDDFIIRNAIVIYYYGSTYKYSIYYTGTDSNTSSP
ncbi:MAG: hypothetical protein M1298_05070 [Chloroflexi bacterium]|nr:hypothetical protein [Chloroflexota bacterium]